MADSESAARAPSPPPKFEPPSETTFAASARPMGLGAFVLRIAGLMRQWWPQGLVILFGLLLEMSFTAAVPMGFKYLIDNAITQRDERVLFMVLGLLGAGVLLVSGGGLLRDWLYARLSTGVLNDLRMRMFDKLQKLSIDFYQRAQVGDILSRFSTDLGAVEQALTAAIPWGLLPLLDLLLSTVLLFALEWRLALVAIMVFPLTLIGPRVVAPRATLASYRRKEDESSTVINVQENVIAQPVVKAYSLERPSLASFRERVLRLGASSARVSFLSSLLERSAGVGILLLQVVVMGVGSWMAFRGELSIGSLASFQALFLTLSYSLAYITQYVPTLVTATGGMQRIDELLREKPRVSDLDAASTLPRLEREIRFEDVSFGYTPTQLSLDHLSFSIRRGESVAFVGPSGSGKSTVLNLLTRFYDPQAGGVLFDGRDIRQVTQDSLRAQMGIVFQESFLFNSSVAANLRIGKPTATQDELVGAARQAEVHDIITAMAQGYDTVVGERGGRLSGGQRQRVAIARAILRDPAILVLDEATSALDAGSEAAVSATLEQVGEGRTVVAVTHRLQQVISADRIFVLDRGRLVEEGKHADLLALGGVYNKLWEKQSGFVFSDGGTRARVETARLRAIPLLANVEEKLLGRMATLFATERIAEDRVIFQEGDAGDKFYIIARGSVVVTIRQPGGSVKQLRVMETGDHFGEIALLEDTPRTATIRTRTPGIFLTLQRDQFLTLLENAPELKAAFQQIADERLRFGSGVQSISR